MKREKEAACRKIRRFKLHPPATPQPKPLWHAAPFLTLFLTIHIPSCHSRPVTFLMTSPVLTQTLLSCSCSPSSHKPSPSRTSPRASPRNTQHPPLHPPPTGSVEAGQQCMVLGTATGREVRGAVPTRALAPWGPPARRGRG